MFLRKENPASSFGDKDADLEPSQDESQVSLQVRTEQLPRTTTEELEGVEKVGGTGAERSEHSPSLRREEQGDNYIDKLADRRPKTLAVGCS